ncbi:MAG: hypothetical protein AAF730_05475 [Bacteroidota bacterium]
MRHNPLSDFAKRIFAGFVKLRIEMEHKRVRVKAVLGDEFEIGPAEKDGELVLGPSASIELPPGMIHGVKLTADQVMTMLAVFASNVGAGIVASYLYEGLKTGRFKELLIGGQRRQSEEDIIAALDDEDVQHK